MDSSNLEKWISPLGKYGLNIMLNSDSLLSNMVFERRMQRIRFWPSKKATLHHRLSSRASAWSTPTKPTKWPMRPAKTQISLGIRPVLSVFAVRLRIAKDPSFLHADSEDSDQTGRMPRLIWVFAARTLILLVLSCRGSFNERVEYECMKKMTFTSLLLRSFTRLWWHLPRPLAFGKSKQADNIFSTNASLTYSPQLQLHVFDN